MTNDPQLARRRSLNPTSTMSFAVAGCAFAAALIGAIVNQWMSGWMAVGGMAGVGLFYLAIGLLNLGSSDLEYSNESELAETAAHRLSSASNVDDFAIDRKLENTNAQRNEKLANASK